MLTQKIRLKIHFERKKERTVSKKRIFKQKLTKALNKIPHKIETQNVGFGHTVCCMQRITNENKTQSPEKSGSFDSLGQRVDRRSAQCEK